MTSVTLDAGNDAHPDGCLCRSCKRRRAMLAEGIVPRVDAVTARAWSNPDHEPDMLPYPPQHPVTGRFMSPPHPDHDDRDTKGRFIDSELAG
jgi:hypothetical protein